MRTYISEPKLAKNKKRRWTDKPPAQRDAVYGNRRRIRGERGRQMSRLRSEYAERSFAHVGETGAGRRLWLRGKEEVSKWHLMRVAAANLGAIMRALFGIGAPRRLHGASVWLAIWAFSVLSVLWRTLRAPRAVRTAAVSYSSGSEYALGSV